MYSWCFGLGIMSGLSGECKSMRCVMTLWGVTAGQGPSPLCIHTHQTSVNLQTHRWYTPRDQRKEFLTPVSIDGLELKIFGESPKKYLENQENIGEVECWHAPGPAPRGGASGVLYSGGSVACLHVSSGVQVATLVTALEKFYTNQSGREQQPVVGRPHWRLLAAPHWI